MADPTTPTPSSIIQHDEYEFLDHEDAKQIVEEINGAVLEQYIYYAEGKPRLSYAGVQWASREYARKKEFFRVIPGTLQWAVDEKDPEYLLITLGCGRYVIEEGKEILADSCVGAKRVWRKMQLKDKPDGTKGDVVPDRFFFEKGVGMAERNGKKKLLPTEFVTELVAKYLASKGKVPPPAKPTPVKSATAAVSTAPAAAAAPTPANNNSTKQATDPKESAIRQRLYANMSKKMPVGADKKQIWRDLTGYPNTTSTPTATVHQWVEIFNDPAVTLELDPTSKKYVAKKGGVAVAGPVPAATTPAAAQPPPPAAPPAAAPKPPPVDPKTVDPNAF
jgi:hypothetical protein